MKEEWRNPKLAGCTPKSVEEMEEKNLEVLARTRNRSVERERSVKIAIFCNFS